MMFSQALATHPGLRVLDQWPTNQEVLAFFDLEVGFVAAEIYVVTATAIGLAA